MHIKMSRKEDPSTLLEQLTKVKAHCASVKFDAIEMIAVNIVKDLHEYQQVLLIEQWLKGAAMRAHNKCRNDDGAEKGVALVNIKENCFKYGKPAKYCK
jgi:hypothetical protein